MSLHYFFRSLYFLMFQSTALSPYASKRERVYQVLASIFYRVSAARGFAAASLPFLVGCRGRGTWRGAAGSALWRRTSFPCHQDMWRMVQLVCVSTCSDSKTRSKNSTFSCLFLLVVHVVIRRVVLTLSIIA